MRHSVFGLRFERSVTVLATAVAVVVLFACGGAVASAEDSAGHVGEDGFRSLFDGQSLEGWHGDPEIWRVENGEIIGETKPGKPLKQNTFLIWEQGEIDDFELQVDFKISSPEGNSGIQVRSFRVPGPEGDPSWRLGGYQADFDAENRFTGLVYGERYRGMLAKPGERAVFNAGASKPVVTGITSDPAELRNVCRKGDWNTYRVVARGNRIQTWINGTLFAELIDTHESARRSGHLGFQVHSGPPMCIHFRNVLLKRTPLEDRKKVVFLAGYPSHGRGAHEHNAGCLLLANELNENLGGELLATVYRNGWPHDPTAFQNADAVVMYLDGGGRHFAKFHLRQLDGLHHRGMGLGAIHYGVEIPKGEGLEEFVKWIGGGFETHWSVNPVWDASFESFPEHPVANGINPFTLKDEWYYHMRFRPQMAGVTPILSAHPPEQTLKRGDGPHSGNPHVRKSIADGQIQHLCWVAESPDGAGRGFGFTGGHFHNNWRHDDFRRTLLNAITWIAGAEVPENGVPTETPTDAELEANLDPLKGG